MTSYTDICLPKKPVSCSSFSFQVFSEILRDFTSSCLQARDVLFLLLGLLASAGLPFPTWLLGPIHLLPQFHPHPVELPFPPFHFHYHTGCLFLTHLSAWFFNTLFSSATRCLLLPISWVIVAFPRWVFQVRAARSAPPHFISLLGFCGTLFAYTILLFPFSQVLQAHSGLHPQLCKAGCSFLYHRSAENLWFFLLYVLTSVIRLFWTI